MSNYTIVTNFVGKDSLVSGNPAKAVKGADFTTEFTAVAAALNTKVDGTNQYFPDGTATQPSVGFTNNSGTGMFNAGGVLGFATGAASRMTISAAGNVAISAPASGATSLNIGVSNTTFSPTGNASFVINNVASGQSSVDFQIAGTMVSRIRSDFTGSISYVTAGSGTHAFFTGGDSGVGTVKMSISSAGNVTINGPTTIAPAASNALSIATGGNGIGLLQTSTGGAANAISMSDGNKEWRILDGYPTLGTFNIFDWTDNTSNPAFQITPATYPLVKAVDQSGNLWDVGWRDLPQTAPGGVYTPVLADRGKHIYTPNNVTIPANATTAFPVGTSFVIVNSGGSAITVSNGDTMYLAGGSLSTGTRTLGVQGVATLLKVTVNTWYIFGLNIT